MVVSYRMKHMRIFILLFLIPCISIANDGIENLGKSDFHGAWHSDWTSFKGESHTLIINADLSTSFIRELESGEVQSFKSEPSHAELKKDLIILKYGSCRGVGYKLVLSGWKLEHMKKLYGFMFMYRNGKQFNGVPVSFIIEYESS